MGRPSKQTVDYFPHYCRHGKTLMILEQKYGNDGYAFWFKLLEMLGDSDGHYIDMNDLISWEFLQSKTRLTEDICREILNLLARLKAIDTDYWENIKVVWCANFVANVSDAYRNRVVETPKEPDFLRQKYLKADSFLRQNSVRNPHSRVEESRVKESRKDNASPFFSCAYFSVDLVYREKLSAEYPLLNDQRLSHELSKMEDWLSDNKGRKKFGANGKMKNPKLFIKNWLDKMVVTQDQTERVNEPKGYAGIREFLKEG